MNTLITLLAAFVALLHVYFLYLEMFMWTRPKGLKIFNQTLEQAKASATLAANQGLYNGFLAAGLIWSLFTGDAEMRSALQVFFLSCVAVAGLYGGYSVHRRIFFIQGVPALATLGLVLITRFA